MSTTVGSLKVLLSADATSFTRGVQSATSALGGLKGMIAGMVSAGALVAFAAKALETGDKLSKLANATKMSTEALSVLRYQADQDGVSLEQLAASLGKLQVQIGEAAKGGKQASDALGALGLSAQQLISMSPDARFVVIAEALSKVGDATKQAEIAQALFGKSYQMLLPLINSGAEGFRIAAENAARYNQIVGTESAAASERANDAMSNLSKGITGLGEKFVRELGAPLLEKVIPPLEILIDILSRLGAVIAAPGKFLGGLTAGINSMIGGNIAGGASIIGAEMPNDILQGIFGQSQSQLEQQKRMAALMEEVAKNTSGTGAAK